jgi:hypothetical protein
MKACQKALRYLKDLSVKCCGLIQLHEGTRRLAVDRTCRPGDYKLSCFASSVKRAIYLTSIFTLLAQVGSGFFSGIVRTCHTSVEDKVSDKERLCVYQLQHKMADGYHTCGFFNLT